MLIISKNTIYCDANAKVESSTATELKTLATSLMATNDSTRKILAIFYGVSASLSDCPDGNLQSLSIIFKPYLI